MNTINKDELFGHVREFLKAKGIELQEGSYSRTIHKGCQVLADTINMSQQAVDRAKSEIEKQLEQVRTTIHRKTAPRKPPVVPKTEAAPEPDASPKPPRSHAARRNPAASKASQSAKQPPAKKKKPRRPRPAE